MRLAWPPPWHLIASVLIPVIALAQVHLSPQSLQGYLSLLALISVLLIPGYLATLSLFPGKSDLSGQRRAFLCLVTSTLLAGLFSLILKATPRGLQSASLATILSLLAIFLAAVAYGRWSNLPRSRRFLLLPKRGMRSELAVSHIFGAGITGKRSALAIVLLAACFIAALAFAFGPYHFPSSETFTKPEATGQDESWQDKIGFMLTGPATSPGQEALDPFKDDNLSSPYEEERLWVNQPRSNSVQSGSKSQTMINSTKINTTENNSPVIFEDKSKVTVFSTGGGGSGGAVSEDKTQTAVNKPASQKALQPEKTVSSPEAAASTTASKENQTRKDNLTFYKTDWQEIKSAAKSASSSISEALSTAQVSLPSGKPPSVQVSDSNHLPAINALVPDRASPQLTGTAIFWKAEASDEEGDKILYKFLLDGREVRKWSKTNSWSWLSAGLPAGDYQITVLVIDGKHASEDSFDGSMSATFKLNRPNQAPSLQQLKSDKASPQGRGDMITWTASATDPDNDTIYYKFMKNGEDVTDWSASNSWVWDTSSEKPGSYKIAVLAKDGLHVSKKSFDSTMDGTFVLTLPNNIPEVTDLKADRSNPQAKDATITTIVGDSNQPPVLKTLVPDIASPKAQGATVIWRAKAQDPEGDKILYKFQLNGRDMSRWSESASWKWSSKDTAAGDYKISVLARDGKHATEGSFDSSMDAYFTLVSEIDQQIDQLMKKRSTEASQQENYQSSDIHVTSSTNGSKSNTVLGKNR
jgi:hypothetical protein